MKINTEEGKTFFYILLAVALFISYFLLEEYIATIAFSFVVVLMFRPVYDRYFRWFGCRRSIATAVTLVTIFLTLLIPVFLIINITVNQALEFQGEISTLVSRQDVSFERDSLTIVVDEVNQILARIPFSENYRLTEEKVIETVRNTIEPVATFLGNKVLSIGSSSVEWVAKFIIFLTIIIVLLPQYHRFIQLLKDLSPLDDQLDQIYIDRMTAMTKSMSRGVFIIAFIQGLVTGLLFWIAGIDYVLFFTILAIFLSILPMGAQLLSIPAGLVLLLLGKIWQGIFLIAGSMVIVGNIDNLLRPYLVPKETELNSALVLLSAFGGLGMFGFLGIIYGPVIMIFLVTTLEIYLEYYQPGLKRRRRAEAAHSRSRSRGKRYGGHSKNRSNRKNQSSDSSGSGDAANASATSKSEGNRSEKPQSSSRQRRKRPPRKRPSGGGSRQGGKSSGNDSSKSGGSDNT